MNKLTNRVSHETEASLLRVDPDHSDDQLRAQVAIVKMVKQANQILEEAAVIAEKNGLPFEYAVMTHETRDEWISSDDCYGSWDTI